MEREPEIPAVVIERLPVYVRALAAMAQAGTLVVSSQDLGATLGVTPAQIRKDLSNFGRFGKQGRGYDVQALLRELRQILGLDRDWNACVIGVGRLGQALVEYRGFPTQGFHIVAALDVEPGLVGTHIGPITVQSIDDLESVVGERGVQIGIVAVPAPAAQGVVDRLIRTGITAIVNYAPMTPIVPPHVRVRQIDPVVAMQAMTFYLKEAAGNEGGD